MKYFFLLGRNPQLSEAEIVAYFERSGIIILNHSITENGMLVECDKEIDVKRAIDELGGAIACGKVIFNGAASDVAEMIKKKPIYFEKEIKMIYSIFNFSDEETFSEIYEAMRENFRKEGLKARYKGLGGTIKMQDEGIARGSPSKMTMRDKNYFIFSGKEISFGVIEALSDVAGREEREMNKPVRREELAISPRLAKILVNLSGVKRGGNLADPFCGIGAIAQEAILMGVNATGVDISKSAIDSARKNLGWVDSHYRTSGKYRIINADSKTGEFGRFTGIATEPELGKLLLKTPGKEEAERIINGFEELVIGVFNNIKKQLRENSKVAFTAPLILVSGSRKRIGVNFERICDETGLKIRKFQNAQEIKFPIHEFREKQVVGREICVLEN